MVDDEQFEEQPQEPAAPVRPMARGDVREVEFRHVPEGTIVQWRATARDLVLIRAGSVACRARFVSRPTRALPTEDLRIEVPPMQTVAARVGREGFVDREGLARIEVDDECEVAVVVV